VVIFNRTHRVPSSNLPIRVMLSAACLSAGVTLCGCGFRTAEQEAQAKANEAARLTASAGQPRATEQLVEEVSGTSIENLKDLEKRIEAESKSGASGWSKYITQGSADKDLMAASAMLASINKSDLDPSVASAIEAQSGYTLLELSIARLKTARMEMAQLIDQALILEDLAQQAVDLGASADALSKVQKPDVANNVDKAKQTLADANATLEKAKQAEAALKKDLDDKTTAARKIYADTEAAFLAADNLKGQQAIDAANKAIEARKEAEKITAEAANMEPQLFQASAAVQAAEAAQKSAEIQLTNATNAVAAAADWAKQHEARIANLREQAKTIVSSDHDGVAARYKALAELEAKVNEHIEAALKAAKDAEGSFRNAATQLTTANGKLSAYVSDAQLDAKDPLNVISKDKRPAVIMLWTLAAAADQTGRVNCAGMSLGNLMNTVTEQVARAHKSAGLSPDTSIKIAANPDSYKKDAADAFSRAQTLAGQGNTTAIGDADRIKWIGLALDAIAQQGAAIASGGSLDAAKAAAARAAAANPDLKGTLERAGI
jgi:hypothetical protein